MEVTQEQVTQMVKTGLEASGFTEETAKALKEVKEVKRAPIGETKEHIANVTTQEPDKFKSFGEQLKSVYLAAVDKSFTDNRLLTKQLGLSEGIDSMGGFLVQPEFAAGIIQKAFDTGEILSRCRKVTIGPNSNSLTLNALDETSRVDGSRQGGVLGYWLPEAGTKLPSHPLFRQMTLKLNKVAAVYYATDELVQDVSAIESLVSPMMVRELQFQIENTIIRGTGVNQPFGILPSGATITVAQRAGQGIDSIVSGNIMDMWARMYAPSRANAVWFYNQDCEQQLMGMGIVVGLGGTPIYMPPGGLSASPYSTLLGKPCIPIQYADTVGTRGDLMLLDLQEYLLADKGGVQSAFSAHVAFLTDEGCWRFVMRVDGQPLWNAPLTPFLGANTLSPFVTLVTRV